MHLEQKQFVLQVILGAWCLTMVAYEGQQMSMTHLSPCPLLLTA